MAAADERPGVLTMLHETDLYFAIMMAEDTGGTKMDVFNDLIQAMVLDGVPGEVVQPVLRAGDAITEWYRENWEGPDSYRDRGEQ
jgi:hypothetical protein